MPPTEISLVKVSGKLAEKESEDPPAATHPCLELVEELWDTIAEDADKLPLTEAQAAELDRRLAAHDAAPDEGVSWSELRDRLQT